MTVVAPGVLNNDSDVEDEYLSAAAVESPAHGTLVLNADGSFEYTPHENYFGLDSFSSACRDLFFADIDGSHGDDDDLFGMLDYEIIDQDALLAPAL